MVDLLLSARADPTVRDAFGWTPLHWLCFSGRAFTHPDAGEAVVWVMSARVPEERRDEEIWRDEDTPPLKVSVPLDLNLSPILGQFESHFGCHLGSPKGNQTGGVNNGGGLS